MLEYLRSTMLVFPHAKINLGLNVLRKRADGYHDIETVFYPIPLCDALEALVEEDLGQGQLVYTRSGIEVPGDPTKDLCVRAHALIIARRTIPGVRLHLHKMIPMGAGLGGGSSDGAHTLLLLDTLLNLKIPKAEMLTMAAELGSDCPFFFGKGAMLASGRGEMLTSLGLDLAGLHLVLIHPNIHVGTSEVYANTKPSGQSIDLGAVVRRSGIPHWQKDLVNTMEPFVASKHPLIAEIKQLLIEKGALYAAMSGSGSTVFGIFPTPPEDLELPTSLRATRIAL
jgi:4-diphosphocytidyl-2-C-methyl-D-erythritol kinase